MHYIYEEAWMYVACYVCVLTFYIFLHIVHVYACVKVMLFKFPNTTVIVISLECSDILVSNIIIYTEYCPEYT